MGNLLGQIVEKPGIAWFWDMWLINERLQTRQNSDNPQLKHIHISVYTHYYFIFIAKTVRTLDPSYNLIFNSTKLLLVTDNFVF